MEKGHNNGGGTTHLVLLVKEFGIPNKWNYTFDTDFLLDLFNLVHTKISLRKKDLLCAGINNKDQSPSQIQVYHFFSFYVLFFFECK